MSKYIYRIEHSFSFSNDESCLIIESNIPPLTMQRIIVYICYRFDELVCETLPVWNFDMDREHLLDILMNLYHVKNIKNDLSETLIKASAEINESIKPLDYCYPTMFNNVYYMDIFDLWEYLGSEHWIKELLHYLQGKADEVDKLILEWKSYQGYRQYYLPLES